MTELKREEFLAHALAGASGYDVVLIDCPPNLGLLTVNALFAAGEVLVPVSMLDGGAFQGAGEVLATIRRLAGRGVALEVAALVRTLVDRRRVSYQAISDALSELDAPLAAAEIPLRADFNTALLHGRPLAAMRPDGAGALAYRRLAEELAAAAPSRVFEGRVAMADRPQLKMVDDPLAPARTPLQREPEAEEHGAAEEQPRPRAARKPLQGIFGRVSPELARRLEGMVFELKAERARVSQQDVLAALLWRHVDHTDPASVRAMHELLDEYETESGTEGQSR